MRKKKVKAERLNDTKEESHRRKAQDAEEESQSRKAQ